jgi:hypothetical protein
VANGAFSLYTRNVSPQDGIALQPVLLPANVPSDWFEKTSPTQITLVLANVAGANALPAQCALPLIRGNDLFTLAWTQRSDSQAGMLAQITVKANPANIDDGSLLAAFQIFKRQLADMQSQGSGCLAPSAAAVIARRIATALPLPYDQILPFACAYNTVGRYADLLPGMRLAIGTALYQFAGIVAPLQSRNSYGAAGLHYLPIRRRSDGTIGFNAFVDELASITLFPQGGAATEMTGSIDLALSGNRMPFYRLVYPAQLDPVAPTQAISTYNPNLPILIGATDLASLETSTTAWIGAEAAPPSNSVWLGFSGRATIIPEISISLNGTQIWVALGTTLADLVSPVLTAAPIELIKAVESSSIAISMWRWAVSPNLGPQPVSVEALPINLPQTAYLPNIPIAPNWATIPLLDGDVVIVKAP